MRKLELIKITLCLIFTVTNFLFAEENSSLLNKAAELFQKEKKDIKSFKVEQEVISKIKESSSSVTEKRIQVGYYKYPDEYIFICKEIELNGIKQILAKPLIEKTSKSEVDWLSVEGLKSYSFQSFYSDSKMIKFLVSPNKIQTGYYRGQLWLDLKTARILKIFKEPIIKKKEIISYSIELNFEKDFGYQVPSRTFLSSIYNINGKTTEVQVEAAFKNYLFNQDLSQELPK